MEERNAGKASDQIMIDDPLVAGLPPAMDYITYLTLLEYQLTPQNLSTLNRLLREDDGTLASEIGWDLLKLVLPILRVNQDAAQDCLSIIARRGNPREVIVRVSEELERLGHHESDQEEADEDSTEPQVFQGEAPPVHLGQMTLDGNSQPLVAKHDDVVKSEIVDMGDGQVPGVANDELIFAALVSMLPHLHSRIKTKYPSRFLATSLPAALGAFRRLSMSEVTTTAVLKTLQTLGGVKRPPLPPRVSTSDVLKSSETTSAPLPDPESKKDVPASEIDTAKLEAAINERLLQAVLLEIFEERTVVSMEDHPPLTAQLRLKIEPHSLLSTRRAEIESLAKNEAVQTFNRVQAAFISAAETLKLNLSAAILDSLKPACEVEEVGEYPTSPHHIPLSVLGLLLLYSSRQVSHVLSSSDPPSSPPEILEALRTVILDKQSEDYNKVKNSTPAIDNILSLIYMSQVSAISQDHLIDVTNYLLDICTECPDVDLRDNAHHIATCLIHSRLDQRSRLSILKKLILAESSENEQLRGIAVNWLKDEIFPTQISQAMISKLPELERGLQVQCLTEFADSLFSTRAIEQSQHGDRRRLLGEIPFYISVINLLVLLAKHVDEVQGDHDADMVLAKGEAMLNKLDTICADLVSQISQSMEGFEEQGGSSVDVYALEDALIRAREVLPHE